MSASKVCAASHADGRPCRATPMAKARFCFWHDPDTSVEASEARRLGGLRRKRERTVAAAYDVAGLGDIASVRRLYEVAVIDTLSLENGPSRNRLLVAIADGATRLLEAEREAALAASLLPGEDG